MNGVERAEPVEQALAHLLAAVAAAEALSEADIFSPWSAFAAQIRLAASAIDPTALPSRPKSSTSSVHECLTRAVAALGRTPAGPDQLMWISHAIYLLRVAERLESRP